MENEEVKLCKNCKWNEPYYTIFKFGRNCKYDSCLYPGTIRIDKVCGRKEYWHCSVSRKFNYLCGESGSYFEAKEINK